MEKKDQSGQDPATLTLGARKDVSPYCKLRIDKEGRWFYEDRQIVHPAIYRYFNQCLRRDGQGRYIICTEEELCAVEVEDAPFVVVQVLYDHSPGRVSGAFIISLNDGTQENLDIDGLWVGEDNILYCLVKGGSFHARFLRPAYYQLAEFVESEAESGSFFIAQGRKRY